MDGRNVRVEDDGTIVYRASALGGQCTRALVLSRLGYEEAAWPKDMATRAKEGFLHEEDVLRRMRDEGWTVWDEQAEVTLMVSGKIKVVGHVDGKGTIVGKAGVGNRIVEVKSQSKDEWNNFDRDGWDSGYFPNYKWQLSCYMLATGYPAVLFRKNRNDGRIDVVWVDEPFYDLREIRSRVLSIELLASDGVGPEDCGPGTLYPCPFYYLPGHSQAVERARGGGKGVAKDGGVPVPRRVVDGEVAKEVDSLATRYELARQNEKSAKMAKDEAKSALQSLSEGAPGLDVPDGARVTFYEQRVGRRALPSSAEDGLRAFLLWWFGVDLDNYRQQSVAQMMKVTLPTTEEGKEGMDRG